MRTPDQNEIRVGLLRDELKGAVRDLVDSDFVLQLLLQKVPKDGNDLEALSAEWLAQERVNRAKRRCEDLAKRIVDLEPRAARTAEE